MILQRDAFLQEIHRAALRDKDIYLLSADFGAETLDAFRRDCPDQFVHCGISEQHMIDMAAGLALSGKRVYCYAMGPFLALRCYEQIKCCLAMMHLPVTLISVGVGLGYADSGPTHYLTEDIACLRALNGMEIVTASDAVSAAEFARESLSEPFLRYIRLDRGLVPELHENASFRDSMAQGFLELDMGRDVCLISSGYMLHRTLDARDRLVEEGRRPGVIDLFRIKPIDAVKLAQVLRRYKTIVTVEEQCLSGGFGSTVLEALNDIGLFRPVHRLGLPDRYYFENGGRDTLLDTFGLSVDAICDAVREHTDA